MDCILIFTITDSTSTEIMDMSLILGECHGNFRAAAHLYHD